MSGVSPNQRFKKNGKKNKTINNSEVVQVKSVKLDTSSKKNGKPNAKSEDNLRKSRKFNKSQVCCENDSNGDASELEACILKKIQKMTLNGDEDIPGNSQEPDRSSGLDQAAAVVDEQQTEHDTEANDYDVGDNFTCTYQYNPKNTKSIKFTNQVTVLYFNGEDVLCESMEPLKKEIDQQLRNKEMRKEHLMKAGHEIDNLYLF